MDLPSLFARILPPERIVSERLVELYGGSTTGAATTIPCALKPGTTEEIQSIVRIANEHRLKLYPISTGKNWGYTDSLPVTDNNVLIDLSMMNRIIEYNQDLAYVTLEPGVTQRELAEALKAAGDKHIVSPTGASTDASVVGNYLERGYGIAPIMNHAEAVTSLKAVLPDGSLYESVLARKNLGLIDRLHVHGLGPYTDGLFFQSGFGIVTEMTIRLAPKPEACCVCLVGGDRSSIAEILDRMREIRARWGVRSVSIKVSNSSYRMATWGLPYPAKYLEERGAIPRDVMDELCRKEGIPPFSLTATFSGPRPLLRLIANNVRKSCSDLAVSYQQVDELGFRLAMRFRRLLPRSLRDKVAPLPALWSVLKGTPSNDYMKIAYWRKGVSSMPSAPANPSADGVGLIWYGPIIPFSGAAFTALESLVDEVCRKHGINPMINVTNFDDHYCIGLTVLQYRREDQTEAAIRCYAELVERGFEQGIAPYRLGRLGVGKIFDGNDLGAKLKRHLDPHGVLAPGRYDATST